MAATMTIGYTQPMRTTIPDVVSRYAPSTDKYPRYDHVDELPSLPSISLASHERLTLPPPRSNQQPSSSGATIAAQRAAVTQVALTDDGWTKSRPVSRPGSRPESRPDSRRISGDRIKPLPSILSASPTEVAPPKSPSKAAAAKERFRSNLKRITQQKEGDITLLDLSKTAEENEKMTGIDIQTVPRSSQSFTDMRLASIESRRRFQFPALATDLEPYKPSAPFSRLSSVPPTSDVAPLSYAASIAGSELSGVDTYPFYRPSFNDSRPSLCIVCEGNESVKSVNRARRSTNQSATSASPSTPSAGKSGKSVDKAFAILTRGSSAGTVDSVDGKARVASIQAARQAFDRRQEEKDAKYEQRRAKEQERRQKKMSGRSLAAESKLTSTALADDQNGVVAEKDGLSVVEGREYSSLPVSPLNNRPKPGMSLRAERTRMSSTRRARSRYAGLLSWIKTKVLNLKRRLR